MFIFNEFVIGNNQRMPSNKIFQKYASWRSIVDESG